MTASGGARPRSPWWVSRSPSPVLLPLLLLLISLDAGSGVGGGPGRLGGGAVGENAASTKTLDRFSVVNGSSDDLLLPLPRRGSTSTLSSLMYPRRRLPRSPHGVVSSRELSTQISTILDGLFNSSYNHQVRPGLGKDALRVEVGLHIRSMGPVDERRQMYALDCYFRQTWIDGRLRYNNSRLPELSMNWQFLSRIWRPDTYFVNGKDSYLHMMTVPNRFIRIYPDGRIKYSQRLTVKARCQMDLHNFPLDKQICPLSIGSFGHTTDDIIYRWAPEPVTFEQGEDGSSKLGLAQYKLTNWSYSEVYRTHGRVRANVSVISLHFAFHRQTGFYLLQIYVPLTLIVMCSWVTFWLRKTEKGSEIPARTSLGASSVLSIVTIGFSGKDKPQVGYATALDIFIVVCFVNVFAALVEFAIINFLDTLVRRLKRKDAECRLVALMSEHSVMGFGRKANIPVVQETTMDTDGIGGDDIMTPPGSSTPPPPARSGVGEPMFNFNGGAARADLMAAVEELERHNEQDCISRFADSVVNCIDYFNWCKPIREMEIYRRPHVIFNRVDACSRKLFPATFLLVNLFYWCGYIYVFDHFERDIASINTEHGVHIVQKN